MPFHICTTEEKSRRRMGPSLSTVGDRRSGTNAEREHTSGPPHALADLVHAGVTLYVFLWD